MPASGRAIDCKGSWKYNARMDRGLSCGMDWKLAIVAGVAFWSAPASAWIFPEHRAIAIEGVRRLDETKASALMRMWSVAWTGARGRMCRLPTDPDANPSPSSKPCVDFATLVALAGDHSCSPEELRVEVGKEDWIAEVQRVGESLKAALAASGSESDRERVWGGSNLALQAADPRYLSRAQQNYAHFPLPRQPLSSHETAEAYLNRCVRGDSPINSIGVYAKLHGFALALAAQSSSATDAARVDLAQRAIFAEAFALHFLEDSFSAGHFAGSWGSNAWRKGTHDVYCVLGLATVTWSGKLLESHGDAHMTADDIGHASEADAASLAQLADAASGGLRLHPPDDAGLDALDTCGLTTMPVTSLATDQREAVLPIVQDTPVPSGGEDSIHPPRFRAEVGPFAGLVVTARAGGATGGYQTTPGSLRARETLEAGARIGYGLEGLLTSGHDGMLWAQASFVMEPSQLDTLCPNCPGGLRTDPLTPRVEARGSFRISVRVPFWIVPGDLLLLAPVLAIASPIALQRVIFDATNGGLIPWQKRFTTDIGTLQFILGREAGLTPNGYVGSLIGRSDSFQSYQGTNPDGSNKLVDVLYRSLEFDLPILEFQPVRAFQSELALGASLQLGFSVEIESVLSSAGPLPLGAGLGPTYFLYLRLGFDARRYF
jgi:hypothetical protein